MASSNARSWEENPEVALLQFPDEEPHRLRRIADCLPEKSPDDVAAHHDSLLHDVCLIESDGVKFPSSWAGLGSANQDSRGKRAKSKRKKGNSWTEEEHRQFLRGLQIYGKGDWRSISRHCVLTREPSQIASHAQKYFERLNKKDKKRPSIHDITIPQISNTHGFLSAADCSSVQQVPTGVHMTMASLTVQQTRQHIMPGASTVQHIPAGASAVQHIPAGASTVQYIPTGASAIQHIPAGASTVQYIPTGASAVQHIPAGASTVQYIPTDASAVQHIPAGASTVQYIPTGASAVQQRPVMSSNDFNPIVSVVSYPNFNFFTEEWE